MSNPQTNSAAARPPLRSRRSSTVRFENSDLHPAGPENAESATIDARLRANSIGFPSASPSQPIYYDSPAPMQNPYDSPAQMQMHSPMVDPNADMSDRNLSGMVPRDIGADGMTIGGPSNIGQDGNADQTRSIPRKPVGLGIDANISGQARANLSRSNTRRGSIPIRMAPPNRTLSQSLVIDSPNLTAMPKRVRPPPLNVHRNYNTPTIYSEELSPRSIAPSEREPGMVSMPQRQMSMPAGDVAPRNTGGYDGTASQHIAHQYISSSPIVRAATVASQTPTQHSGIDRESEQAEIYSNRSTMLTVDEPSMMELTSPRGGVYYRERPSLSQQQSSKPREYSAEEIAASSAVDPRLSQYGTNAILDQTYRNASPRQATVSRNIEPPALPVFTDRVTPGQANPVQQRLSDSQPRASEDANAARRGDSRFPSDSRLAEYPQPASNYAGKPGVLKKTTSDFPPQTPNHLRTPNMQSASPWDSPYDMNRGATNNVEKGQSWAVDINDLEDYRPTGGGILSQLLRLNGAKQHRMESRSRASSVSGDFPTMRNLGLPQRQMSGGASMYEGHFLDPDDPRLTGKKPQPRKRRKSLSQMITGADDDEPSRFRKRRASIQLNVADILTRQNFILKLAKALMTFGAPSHRLESQLNATSLILDIDAHFIHFPGVIIASFGDLDTRTSDTHFVKASGGLVLGKLQDVHKAYKQVVHDEIDAGEGTKLLDTILKSPPEYNLWQRMILAALLCGIICPMGFGGSFVDAWVAAALGSLLAFMQLNVASKNSMYSNIFEISIATFVSFVARGVSQAEYFCYESIASAGVCLILPGYIILCGSLELASKSIVAGTSRMVYALLYSLFLGFGIAIGSDIYYVIDPHARARDNAAHVDTAISIMGTFVGMNGTTPWDGTFTFANTSASALSKTQESLRRGTVSCLREPDWPWWRQPLPDTWLLVTVPLFAGLGCLWNGQPLRSKQLPVMIAISCTGYVTNLFSNHYIFNKSDVVSAIGAFVIGVLGNVYARLTGATAFTTMAPGVGFLVPSGIAAAGGLAMTNINDGQQYNQGLIIGFRMVQVGIGITVGLFGSALLIYSFGRKKNAALFAF